MIETFLSIYLEMFLQMRSGHNMPITAKHNLSIYLCNRRLSVFTVNRFVLTVYMLVWSLQIAFNGKRLC